MNVDYKICWSEKGNVYGSHTLNWAGHETIFFGQQVSVGFGGKIKGLKLGRQVK